MGEPTTRPHCPGVAMGPPSVYVTILAQARHWTGIGLCLDSLEIISRNDGLVNLE